MENLRVSALCAYLAAWLVLAAGAIAGAIPKRRRPTDASAGMTVPGLLGMLLQSTAALPITLSLKPGPLRPHPFESAGALVLAPLAAVLFCWALRSGRNRTGVMALVTGGPYAWVRHPMYLVFLAMLVATGLLASADLKLVAATIFYVGGTELRIASEEAGLEERFPEDYAQYRRKTRWRYLPGIR